jgi:hypothetical protein
MTFGLRGRLVFLVTLCAICGVLAATPDPVDATSGNLTAPGQLLPMQPMTGTLDASVPEMTYVFEVEPGFIFSLVAWTRFGDLNPEITLSDSTGQTIATGVPPQAGLNSRVIDAVAGTEGTYVITIRRSGETAGEYRLLLLPGYSVLDKWDDFQSFDQSLSLNWEPMLNIDSIADVSNGMLNMQVMTTGTFSFILPSDNVTWSDVYVEAEVQIEGSPSYFQYGFVLRASPSADAFYALMFSSDGDWTLMFYNMGMWNTIQDWTVSPAIDPTDTTPRIGVFAQGNTFRAYFNGQLVGEVHDPAFSSQAGTIGLLACTSNGQADSLVLNYDNLVITSPNTTAAN